MNSFEYYIPTRIKFGAGMLAEVGKEAKKIGSKALLVSYKNPIVLQSAIDNVENYLRSEDIDIVQYYEVSPNPLVSQVEKGVEIAKSNQVDLVIAVGGGSAMDAAKLIAAGFYYEHEIWNMIVSRMDEKVDIPPTKALPMIMIPTLPATSSEMNCGAVVTNDTTTEKSYVFAEAIYPTVSIIDPELTVSLPAYQTALGIADAISHATETFFNIDDESPLQLRFSQSVIVTLMEVAPKVLKEPENITFRSIVQWAASVAWNGWTKAGSPHGAPMHQFGHVISAYNNVPHGATLSIMMPAWMKYNYPNDIDRYVDYATGVMGIQPKNMAKEETALEGILKFERFLGSIGVPVKLGTEGIGKDSLEKFTDKVVTVSCRDNGTLNSRLPIKRKDIYSIFELAL